MGSRGRSPRRSRSHSHSRSRSPKRSKRSSPARGRSRSPLGQYGRSSNRVGPSPGLRGMPMRGVLASRNPPPDYLLKANMSRHVKAFFTSLYDRGVLQTHDLDYAAIDSVVRLHESAAIAVLEEFASLDLGRLRNPTAFFLGIVKRTSQRQPPPMGRPDRLVGGPMSVMMTPPPPLLAARMGLTPGMRSAVQLSRPERSPPGSYGRRSRSPRRDLPPPPSIDRDLYPPHPSVTPASLGHFPRSASRGRSRSPPGSMRGGPVLPGPPMLPPPPSLPRPHTMDRDRGRDRDSERGRERLPSPPPRHAARASPSPPRGGRSSSRGERDRSGEPSGRGHSRGVSPEGRRSDHGCNGNHKASDQDATRAASHAGASTSTPAAAAGSEGGDKAGRGGTGGGSSSRHKGGPSKSGSEKQHATGGSSSRKQQQPHEANAAAGSAGAQPGSPQALKDDAPSFLDELLNDGADDDDNDNDAFDLQNLVDQKQVQALQITPPPSPPPDAAAAAGGIPAAAAQHHHHHSSQRASRGASPAKHADDQGGSNHHHNNDQDGDENGNGEGGAEMLRGVISTYVTQLLEGAQRLEEFSPEVYNTILSKSVDKVLSTLPGRGASSEFSTQEGCAAFMTEARREKIRRLVDGYIDKYA